MKRKKLRFGKGFRVAFGNRASQAAEMVLEPGGRAPAYKASGDPLPRGRK